MSDIVISIVGNLFPVAAGILAFYSPLNASKIVGTVLTMGGIYGFVNPVASAKVFGIPFANESHALFFPGLAGRNAAIGLSTLILSFLGEKRAVGVLMACTTLNGWSDLAILMWTPGGENLFTHAKNIAVLIAVSWACLRRT